MSDELEARMWDEGGSRYESRGHSAYYESAFASSEHLDRAPLLSEESYTEALVPTPGENDDHCHWTRPEPPSAVPQLVIALALCAIFMICELVGGYLAGSLSVMSDAAHMLSDCGGFALALLAFRCAARPPTTTMSYGYRRAEVLGAMASVLLIWSLTAIFVYVAALRIHTGEYNIEPDIMMLVSGCGVVFNIILALVLHGCASDIAHHHTHGGAACSNAHTDPPRGFLFFKRREKKQSNGASANRDHTMKDLSSAEAHVRGSTPRNINLRAALIHVVGDLIQSCGVLLAAVIIKIFPNAKIVDPLCTFAFSIIVLTTTVRVVREALSVLMQAVPRDFPYQECVSALAAVPGVRHVHSVHAWALSTQHVVLSAHVAVDGAADWRAVLPACQRAVRPRAAHATLQLEPYTPLMHTCAACRQPSAPAPAPAPAAAAAPAPP